MVIYYYFRFISATLKMRERGSNAILYSSVTNDVQSYYICNRYVSVS